MICFAFILFTSHFVCLYACVTECVCERRFLDVPCNHNFSREIGRRPYNFWLSRSVIFNFDSVYRCRFALFCGFHLCLFSSLFSAPKTISCKLLVCFSPSICRCLNIEQHKQFQPQNNNGRRTIILAIAGWSKLNWSNDCIVESHVLSVVSTQFWQQTVK